MRKSGYQFGVDVRLQLQSRLHDPDGIAEGHGAGARHNAADERICCGRHVGESVVDERLRRLISVTSAPNQIRTRENEFHATGPRSRS